MDYLSIYNSIITRAKSENRKRRSIKDKNYIYYERHHILPKCLGGSNDKSNLILLTAREHFVCHQLLVKIYPKNHKLVFAMRMLTASNSKHIRNNKEYEWIRKLVSKTSSEHQKNKSYGYKFQKGHSISAGEKNGMYGKNHTEETRKLQSEKAKNRDPSTYDFARLAKSEMHKEKIRKAKQTKRYILKCPEGKEYTFDRIADASKFSGISSSVLTKISGNRYITDNCRGWRITSVNLYY